jgi:hypothetical protein
MEKRELSFDEIDIDRRAGEVQEAEWKIDIDRWLFRNKGAFLVWSLLRRSISGAGRAKKIYAARKLSGHTRKRKLTAFSGDGQSNMVVHIVVL